MADVRIIEDDETVDSHTNAFGFIRRGHLMEILKTQTVFCAFPSEHYYQEQKAIEGSANFPGYQYDFSAQNSQQGE